MSNPTSVHRSDHSSPVADADDSSLEELRRQKERDKMSARRSRRATYDLKPALREELQSLSQELRIPASQLVNLALARFLKEYHSGKVDLSLYKKPSRSPRYDWNLELPDHLLKFKNVKELIKSLK